MLWSTGHGTGTAPTAKAVAAPVWTTPPTWPRPTPTSTSAATWALAREAQRHGSAAGHMSYMRHRSAKDVTRPNRRSTTVAPRWMTMEAQVEARPEGADEAQASWDGGKGDADPRVT